MSLAAARHPVEHWPWAYTPKTNALRDAVARVQFMTPGQATAQVTLGGTSLTTAVAIWRVQQPARWIALLHAMGVAA